MAQNFIAFLAASAHAAIYANDLAAALAAAAGAAATAAAAGAGAGLF